MMTNRISGGFTLIELLITVAIIAILGTIALPAYYSFLIESRRADAHATLSKIQLAQENYRGSCKQYASGFIVGDNTCVDATSTYQLKWSPLNGTNAISRDGHYEIAISGANGNSYTLTATPVGVQLDDEECKPIWLAVDTSNPNGLKGSGTVDLSKDPADPNNCWE